MMNDTTKYAMNMTLAERGRVNRNLERLLMSVEVRKLVEFNLKSVWE
ncbi:MAG: hypothetical protein QW292_01355 [Candidatus Parvarchaeota archaeon]